MRRISKLIIYNISKNELNISVFVYSLRLKQIMLLQNNSCEKKNKCIIDNDVNELISEKNFARQMFF